MDVATGAVQYTVTLDAAPVCMDVDAQVNKGLTHTARHRGLLVCSCTGLPVSSRVSGPSRRLLTLSLSPSSSGGPWQSGSYVAVGLLDGRVQFYSARRGTKVHRPSLPCPSATALPRPALTHTPPTSPLPHLAPSLCICR